MGRQGGWPILPQSCTKSLNSQKSHPGIKISIPGTLVVATEGFDRFITENNLVDIGATAASDGEIEQRFLAAKLPGFLQADLSAYLEKVTGPLSVRSSGLFEDAYFQAYSGLYKTYMIPNNHLLCEVRREHLFTAVKLVYASTFFKGPLTFKKSTRYHIRRDSMALLIQRLAGAVYGDYFYPAISGVAQSKNLLSGCRHASRRRHCPDSPWTGQGRGGRG